VAAPAYRPAGGQGDTRRTQAAGIDGSLLAFSACRPALARVARPPPDCTWLRFVFSVGFVAPFLGSVDSVRGRNSRSYLFRNTAAEINVTTRPIGNGSVKVIAALIKGLSYICLNPSICRVRASIVCGLAPDALSCSIM